MAEHQMFGGNHFLVLGQESGTILVVEKSAISLEKSTNASGPPSWPETQVHFSQSRQSFAPTGANTSLA